MSCTIGRAAAVLLSLVSASLFGGAARAEMKTQWVEYTQGGTALQGYLAYDDGVAGKRPGILLLHRRDGMSELTLQNAQMYARQGYVVFAADIFGKTVRPTTVPEQEAQSRLYSADRPLMRARATAGLEVLRNNPMVDASKIAIVGYCFGGEVAIELAETGAPILGSVTIHGSFRGFPADAARNIKGRVLILHGADDPVAPIPEVIGLVNQLRAAKVGWELHLYSGTAHGFSTPRTPPNSAPTSNQNLRPRAFSVRSLGPEQPGRLVRLRLPDPPLLVVSDRRQARTPLAAVIAAVLGAGCRWVSLREKDLPEDEQIILARQLLPRVRAAGARLLLHGEARLAALAGTDGVHLPSGSEPAAARALLGPQKLIGVSIHTVPEAEVIDPAHVDYALAGPAFETASKPGYGPEIGRKGLAEIARAARVPVLAIGGINAARVAELIAAGASGIAAMGGVMRSPDPAREVGGLLATLTGALAIHAPDRC